LVFLFFSFPPVYLQISFLLSFHLPFLLHVISIPIFSF
jgi:hypothetical protein